MLGGMIPKNDSIAGVRVASCPSSILGTSPLVAKEATLPN